MTRCDTDKRGLFVVGAGIGHDDDHVGRVVARTCCRRQHHAAHVGQRVGRVGATGRIAQLGRGRLHVGARRIRAQVELGVDRRRVGQQAHTCAPALHVQRADNPRHEQFHLLEAGRVDASRRVEHEDQVDGGAACGGRRCQLATHTLKRSSHTSI